MFASTRSAFPIQAAAMENIDEKQLTFEYVRERLLAAEANELEDFSATTSKSGALIAAGTNATQGCRRPSTRPKTRDDSHKDDHSNSNKTRCNHCGKNGHLKSGCFKLHPRAGANATVQTCTRRTGQQT